VDQDWIEKLVAVGESSDSIGIVGPLSNAATYQSIPEIRPTIKKSMNFFSKSNKNTVINILPNGLSIAQINKFVSRYHTKNSIPIVPLLHGFCLCIKASLLDDIGYFDEKNFAKFYGEENDFCMRSTIAGYKLAVATNVFVFHKKSASIAENDRVLHMDKAGKTLRNIYGAESINIACMQMEKNPILELIRRESKLFFKKFV
jgi:GT2 family glycosyltransferase